METEIQRFTSKEAAEQESEFWHNSKVYFDGQYWVMEWTESPATSTEDRNPSKVREDAQQETSSEGEGRRGDTS